MSEWWLPRAEFKGRVKQEGKQMFPPQNFAWGGGRAALNADWSGCFSIDFRLGRAAGQTRPLVLTVWPLID